MTRSTSTRSTRYPPLQAPPGLYNRDTAATTADGTLVLLLNDGTLHTLTPTAQQWRTERALFAHTPRHDLAFATVLDHARLHWVYARRHFFYDLLSGARGECDRQHADFDRARVCPSPPECFALAGYKMPMRAHQLWADLYDWRSDAWLLSWPPPPTRTRRFYEFQAQDERLTLMGGLTSTTAATASAEHFCPRSLHWTAPPDEHYLPRPLSHFTACTLIK